MLDITAYQASDLIRWTGGFPRSRTRTGSRSSATGQRTDRRRRRQRPDQVTPERARPHRRRFDLAGGQDRPAAARGRRLPAEITRRSRADDRDDRSGRGHLRRRAEGLPVPPGTSNVWRIDPYANGVLCSVRTPSQVQRVPRRVHGHPGHRLRSGQDASTSTSWPRAACSPSRVASRRVSSRRRPAQDQPPRGTELAGGKRRSRAGSASAARQAVRHGRHLQRRPPAAHRLTRSVLDGGARCTGPTVAVHPPPSLTSWRFAS